MYARTHAADESKNEYASQLQNFNAEQWKHFNNAIPHIFKVGPAGCSPPQATEDRLLTPLCLGSRTSRPWTSAGR